MGWRDAVRRREARRVVEERDLPPRLRQGPEGLVLARLLPHFVVSVFIAIALLRHAWVNDQPLLLLGVAAMIAFGFGIAWINKRAHRSKGKRDRRTERVVDSIRWEESER